ncbi:MAG: hypothetical protein ABR985_06215 [Methanotrichaceae archaeon]
MKSRDNSTETLDAYRLSGQTVAFLASGRSIRHITLQGGKHKQNCHIERCQRPNILDRDHKRSLVEIEIVSSFCGEIAVGCFSHTAKPTFDINTVDRELYDSARTVTESSDECDAFLAWLYERALCVFEKDDIWFTIGTLANELVKSRTIEGYRLKILYNQAMCRQNR